ncbi:MAG: hypothetical protein FWD60_13800 [Candidatus Azobacteroides sp.]|nr:hypothetical protein [Candidatus Azobacteroides sp.]
MKKIFIRTLIIIIVVIIAFGAAYFYYPFGDSVKTGQINNVMHKGIIFKTYEGKLIQSGLKSGAGGVGVQSNTFDFSIKNKELADKMMTMTGKEVSLHYKEYFGSLPWRGYTKYIVDSVVSVSDMPQGVQ